MSYRKVNRGTRVPVPGGKLIEEYFGAVHTGTDRFSLARMDAPPGWSEPAQTPEFGELTIMQAGQLVAHVAGEEVLLEADEVLWVEPGVRVHYENRGPDDAIYWAVCLPAFTLDRAHRDPA